MFVYVYYFNKSIQVSYMFIILFRHIEEKNQIEKIKIEGKIIIINKIISKRKSPFFRHIEKEKNPKTIKTNDDNEKDERE